MAQSKQKAEQNFLKELNALAQTPETIHWSPDQITSLDTAFAINEHGILSVTVRYSSDTSFFRVRMEAPVNKIMNVMQDRYISLQYPTDGILVYGSDSNSNELKMRKPSTLFYIGVKEDSGKTLKKLQKLLRVLRKHHPALL